MSHICNSVGLCVPTIEGIGVAKLRHLVERVAQQPLLFLLVVAEGTLAMVPVPMSVAVRAGLAAVAVALHTGLKAHGGVGYRRDGLA